MPQNIMSDLVDKFGICYFKNGQIEACKYHKDRYDSSIFALSDTLANRDNSDEHQVIYNRTPDLLELSNLFCSSKPPAGGWYLVKEQREWLTSKIITKLKILKTTNNCCNILVSGTASYVHFFTFLKIVTNAAKEADFDLSNITVDIIDKCTFPLQQIVAIHHMLKTRFKIKKSVDVMNFSIKLSKKHIKFFKENKRDFKKITIRLFTGELEKNECTFVKYDLITEHFLTSMFYKNLQIVKSIRKKYKERIKKGGSILVATGVSSKSFLNDFIEIHESFNLLLKDEIEFVWDPYGIDEEQLLALQHDKEANIIAAKDNALIEFVSKV